MLSILYELTLQRELQNYMTKMRFRQKAKTQQLNKKHTFKPFPEPGIEPGTSRTTVGCITSRPSRQLKI